MYGHSRPLFLSLSLYLIYFLIVQLVDKYFADVGIQTADLWCRERLLYQLSHHHSGGLSFSHVMLTLALDIMCPCHEDFQEHSRNSTFDQPGYRTSCHRGAFGHCQTINRW